MNPWFDFFLNHFTNVASQIRCCQGLLTSLQRPYLNTVHPKKNYIWQITENQSQFPALP